MKETDAERAVRHADEKLRRLEALYGNLEQRKKLARIRNAQAERALNFMRGLY